MAREAKQLDLANLTQAERDERLSAAATVYGQGTRSQNRSPERKESKAQQKSVTQKYLESEHKQIAVDRSWLMCHCDGWPWPHQAHDMREIEQFRPWRRWSDRKELEWLKQKMQSCTPSSKFVDSTESK